MVVSVACGPDAGDSAPPAPCTAEPAVVPGKGEFTHEPLDDGDRVVMTFGPQGGWHLWTSAEVVGLGPLLEVRASVTVRRTGMSVAGSNDLPLPVDLAEPGVGTWDDVGCTGTFFGAYTYLDDPVPPPGQSMIDVICRLDGEVFDFGLEVTDVETGDVASAVVGVRPLLDPQNVAYCAAH